MIGSPKTAVITGTSGIVLGIAKRLAKDGFAVILCGNDAVQNAAAGPGSPAVWPTSSPSTSPTQMRSSASLPPDDAHRRTGCTGQLRGHPALWERRDDDRGRVEQGDRDRPHRLLSPGALPLSASEARAERIDRKLHLGPGSLEPEQRARLRHVEGCIHALTRAMAVDCARDGIRVNSISPASASAATLPSTGD